MEDHLKILLSGPDPAELDQISALLRMNPQWSVAFRDAATPWPPVGIAEVLILCLPDGDDAELRALAALPANTRPALLICGRLENNAMLRLAMQAGARDFLAPPLVAADLHQALERIRREQHSGPRAEEGRLTAVINGKGGSGASMLASNLAHVVAVLDRSPVVLIDGDLQFGAIPQYFDLNGRDGLLKALKSVDELDAMALEGHMLKHKSGLHLLSCSHEGLVLYGAEEIGEADVRMKKLLGLLRQHYGTLVVDLPRQVDRMTGTVLQMAEDVVIVIQQSLVHIRDAQRLLLFLRELAVQPQRIRIVVNRYEKSAPIASGEIEKALHQHCYMALPNDFQVVSQSVNLGIPLYEYKPHSQIAKAVIELAGKLAAKPLTQHRGGLFSWLNS